ncbi:hypothetical protein B0A81_06255 [Flavobacterium plurextorum]|uniref:Uncharacterized protein n=1 Tax=Flavobacterium plurextorum TaxID=1114867 RepID=A0ABX4CYA0_9FLAO|nr:hypothetical protein [Flavobacterium plurextorum]OXB09369.1 hypothetical protein B0A81_06255 [Flavobacterium plurextorum]
MSEGGKITRIILGESNWTSKGDMNIIATKGDVNFSAAKKVNFHGIEEGVHVGDYDWQEESNKFFATGWYTYDYEGEKYLKRDSRGPKAFLDETIYFHLNVNDKVPTGTEIVFQLWDFDMFLFHDCFNPDDDKFNGKKVFVKGKVREVNGKKRITTELLLDPAWSDDIAAEKGILTDGCLDFYWKWNYMGIEWNSERFLLRVYFSEKTLIIKPAYRDYGFPEIRTADGNIVVFSAGIGLINESNKLLESELQEIKNKLKSEFYGTVGEVVQKYRDKVQHTIAVQQLEKGYLANNLGKIEFSRRIYTKPVFDNSGELYTITKAANFGYRKEGKLVTTKGISQLDYFKDVGLFNKVANASRDLVSIFGFSDVLKYAMDEHPETIMIGFAPADFLMAVVAPELLESIKESWDIPVHDFAEKAKDKGIKGINEFLQSSGGKEKRYAFKMFKINQTTLNKLFRGDFKNLEDMIAFYSKNQSESQLYDVFYYKKNDEVDKTTKIIIDCIFIN